MLPLILLSLLVPVWAKSSLIFKTTALDHVEAGFKKTMRMGVAKEDFTQIEISAKPLLMVEDVNTVDKKRITLEIKADSEPWKVVVQRPVVRGGVYKWTVSNIAPCKNHQIRIWVHGKNESQNSFQFPATIAAASSDALAGSGYQPERPTDLEIFQTDTYDTLCVLLLIVLILLASVLAW